MFDLTQSNNNLYEGSEFKWDLNDIKLSKWTVSREGCFIYERKGNKWKQQERLQFSRGRRMTATYKQKKAVTEIETTMLPVMVSDETGGLRSILNKVHIFRLNSNNSDDNGWILPNTIGQESDK